MGRSASAGTCFGSRARGHHRPRSRRSAPERYPGATLMHLAARGYYLLVLTALLAVAGIWADHPAFESFWRASAIALLLGLAFEGWAMRRTAVTASIEVEPRLY